MPDTLVAAVQPVRPPAQPSSLPPRAAGVQSRAARPLVEIVRRLLLLIFLGAAVWAACRPADGLLRVGLVDLAADKTRNRTIRVSAQPWEEFYAKVAANLNGRASGLASHAGRNIGAGRLYFACDTEPLAELAGQINAAHCFTYVAIGSAGAEKWLGITYETPADAVQCAPTWLLYPCRSYAVWFFLLALGAYAFLPWAKPDPSVICYTRGRSTVVPDMLGAAMFMIFAALPFLVITCNERGADSFKLLDFGNGWAWMTLIVWLFAAGAASICMTSLWYATSAIVLRPDGIRKVTLWGQRDYAYADITAVEPARRQWPRWLRLTFFFFGLFNWRLMGMVLLTSSRVTHGVALRCKNGRTVNIWIDFMANFRRLFHALQRAGVPLDAELNKIIAEDMAADPNPAPSTGRTGRH